MNIYAAIAAFLIAFVYILFLRRMDIFEKEKPIYTFVTFVLGSVFLFLVFVLQAIWPLQQMFSDEGNLLVRLQFHIIAVALFEETVKILPFLIMFSFRRIVNEPFDFIKYASVGAMGFAAVENVLYFSKYSLEIVESRAFYTSIMHMFTSSIIAYQMMYVKYKLNKSAWLGFVPGFISAMFIHGLYNALIGHQQTYYLGIALTVGLLVLWGRIMNNALNASPFFDETVLRKTFWAGIYLLLGWGAIFIYAVLGLYIQDGMNKALQFLQEGIIFGLLSGIGLFSALAFPKLKRGEWKSLFRRFGR
jgi:RsiW-degrading membrane proteinase PrsW (M82 family)